MVDAVPSAEAGTGGGTVELPRASSCNSVAVVGGGVGGPFAMEVYELCRRNSLMSYQYNSNLQSHPFMGRRLTMSA
jgi:hypothetical protein